MKRIQVQTPNFLTSLIFKLQYNDVQQTTDHEGTGKIYEENYSLNWSTYRMQQQILCMYHGFLWMTGWWLSLWSGTEPNCLVASTVHLLLQQIGNITIGQHCQWLSTEICVQIILDVRFGAFISSKEVITWRKEWDGRYNKINLTCRKHRIRIKNKRFYFRSGLYILPALLLWLKT